MIDILLWMITDVKPGRLIESIIVIVILMWKLKPHMTKMEDRMMGLEVGVKNLEKTMQSSFKAGDQRFSDIERRLEKLEQKE